MKMNMSLPITNIRSYVANEFSALRTRALRDTLWARLVGKQTGLAKFPEGVFQKGPNRKLIGTMDIPVEEIIGTLYRHSDFDHKFRPLKKNLRDRWVNIYLLHEKEGWPPIVVHKVEDSYYIEDGHHRVSVARALGIAFIQAKVWEYPGSNRQPKPCEKVKCNEQSYAKKYITATE
jgi:hypothetical protein